MSVPPSSDDARGPAVDRELRATCHDILNVMTVICGVQDELQHLAKVDPALAKQVESLGLSLTRLQGIANRLRRLREPEPRSHAAD